MARVTTVEVVALAPEGGGGGFTRGLRWKGAAGKRKSVRTAALVQVEFPLTRCFRRHRRRFPRASNELVQLELI